MPAWRYQAIGATLGLTILFSPLYFPKVLYVYYFLVAMFFVSAVEYYITTIFFNFIFKQKKGG
jgi:hypothetical protein